MTRLHFAVETDMVTWDGVQPVCGNDFRHTKKLTDDPAQVTCRQCLTLCGFEAAPVEQLYEQGEITMFGDRVEQFTETVGDPLLRRRA